MLSDSTNLLGLHCHIFLYLLTVYLFGDGSNSLYTNQATGQYPGSPVYGDKLRDSATAPASRSAHNPLLQDASDLRLPPPVGEPILGLMEEIADPWEHSLTKLAAVSLSSLNAPLTSPAHFDSSAKVTSTPKEHEAPRAPSKPQESAGKPVPRYERERPQQTDRVSTVPRVHWDEPKKGFHRHLGIKSHLQQKMKLMQQRKKPILGRN